MNIIEKVFGTHSERELKLIYPIVDKIEALRPEMVALTDEPAPVMKVIRESYPAALRCARTIASLLELRLDTDISDDETAYLAMHVARVTGHAS